MGIEEEKGFVFDLKKYAIHDGPGIRTTVFLKGCPLNCWWCHNPESQKLEPEPVTNKNKRRNMFSSHSGKDELIGREVSVNEIMTEIIKDRIFYDESGGGATFSGGEPLMQLDFLQALLTECKNEEIHTTVDTSGFASSDSFKRINDSVDLYLYDIKLMNDDEHKKYTGISNQIINENLKNLLEFGMNVRIRIPLIPGITDTDKNLSEIIEFISSQNGISNVDLLPYNEIGESKYNRLNIENKIGKKEKQSDEQMERLKNKFESSGYVVNIRG